MLLALSPYCLCCSGFACIHWLGGCILVHLFVHSLPSHLRSHRPNEANDSFPFSHSRDFCLRVCPISRFFVSACRSLPLFDCSYCCLERNGPSFTSFMLLCSLHLSCQIYCFICAAVAYRLSSPLSLRCTWFSGICLCWAATPLFFLMSLLLPIAAATAVLRLSARSVAKLQQQHSRALQVAFQRATVALNSRRQLRSLNGEAVEAKAFDMAVRRPAWCCCLCRFSCSLLVFLAAYILFMLARFRHRPFRPV